MIKDYLELRQEAQEGGDLGGISQEDIARLSAPYGAFAESDGKVSEEEESVVEGTQTSPEPSKGGETTQEFTPSEDWNIVKDIEGFVMPEDLTAENEKDLLKSFIAKKYDIKSEELHPLARQIQDMANDNPDITINDLVEDVSNRYVDASKMTTEEKIAFDLYARYGAYDETENKDGLTDEDIKEYISKLTKIEKNNLSKQIESNIEEYNKSLQSEFLETRQKQYEERYDEIVKQLDKHFDKLSVDVSNIDKVYGIPVNQEEHKIFLEEFKKLVTPDKATGQRGIDDILSNDVTLYKMFLLATKFGEDKVIELITQGREAGKKELMEKLKITPTVTGTMARAQAPNSKEAEIALLRQPAR